MERVLYICDREKCDKCFSNCDHTTDINHAANFKKIDGIYIEQESGGNTFITNNYYNKEEE